MVKDAADIDDVLDELKKVEGAISELSCQETEIAKLESRVDKIYLAMFGNGDLSGGIVGRILIFSKWMENRIWFERVLIGAIVSEGVAIVTLLFTVLNRIEVSVWTLKDHLVMLLQSIF